MSGLKHIKIKISEKDEEIISVTLPFKLLALAEQFIPKNELKKHGIDLKKIAKVVEEKVPEGTVIDLANIYDKDKNVHVEVFVE